MMKFRRIIGIALFFMTIIYSLLLLLHIIKEYNLLIWILLVCITIFFNKNIITTSADKLRNQRFIMGCVVMVMAILFTAIWCICVPV